MAGLKPTDATAYGTVTLPPPLPPVIFSTAPSTPNILFYNYKDYPLSSLLPQQDAALDVGLATTVHWWWNQGPSVIGYKWLDAQQKELGSTAVTIGLPAAASPVVSTPAVPAHPSKPSPVPATTTSESASNLRSVETTSSAAAAKPSAHVTKDGLAVGVIAGIAAGSLAVGALLAGAILWCLWKRRRPTRNSHHEASGISLIHQEKGYALQNVYGERGYPSSMPISGPLPLPLGDQAISGEISKIGNSIKNHVQSFYHNDRVSPGQIDYDDVQALGRTLPISAGTLSTLLSNSATREIALRFSIGFLICGKMLPSRDAESSLLPIEVAESMRRMADTSNASRIQAAQLARWRGSTAELLQLAYVQNAWDASDSRISSVQATIRALENILRPYANPRMDNEQRKRNLGEIIKRAATFAFILFSQPSTWVFDWREEQGVRSGELCVFPALLQVTDDSGESVTPPRPFSEPVVRQLDG